MFDNAYTTLNIKYGTYFIQILYNIMPVHEFIYDNDIYIGSIKLLTFSHLFTKEPCEYCSPRY